MADPHRQHHRHEEESAFTGEHDGVGCSRGTNKVAREVAGGRIELHRGAPLTRTLDALRALPGVGEWTVQLVAMRALAWPDAFPASDIGVMNALGTRDAALIATRAEAWRPWRSYAVMRLWQSLDTGT